MAADPGPLCPVLEELIRTEVCPESVTLVVDRISVVCAGYFARSGAGDKAFRLWLGDGCKSIQAIVKQEMHPYLATSHIREGSYLEITNYSLASAKRVNGNGRVHVLQVAEFKVVGHDSRESQPVRFEEVELSYGSPLETPRHKRLSQHKQSTPDLDIDSPGSLARFFASQKSLRDEKALYEDVSAEEEAPLVPPPRLRVKERATDLEPENMPASPPKRKREVSSSPLKAISDNQGTRPVKAAKIVRNMPAVPEMEPSSTLKEVTRPVKVTPLSKIVGPRTIRNRIHDVLAVVCSVEDTVIHRRGMPEQRSIRITDQSTTKQVQLTVFVNASEFQPEVGTVALFRNVCTHEWNGGSLKASQRDCANVRWYLPNPDCIDPKLLLLLQHCWQSRRAIQNEGPVKQPKPSRKSTD